MSFGVNLIVTMSRLTEFSAGASWVDLTEEDVYIVGILPDQRGGHRL